MATMMKSASTNIPEFKNQKILIAPLNWGLGHATRCYPLIEHYLKLGNEVHIASDGQSLEWLKNECDQQCIFHELPGYNIEYRSSNFILEMVRQFPQIKKAIRLEKEALLKWQTDQKFDIVISDNRYGLWDDGTLSIFMTHQLNVVNVNALTKKLFTSQVEKWIKPFDQIWIPDYNDRKLSGLLSEGMEAKQKMYLGPLSRYQMASTTTKDGPILVLLSGPEPMRTYFEDILSKTLANITKEMIWVRGTTTGKPLDLPATHEVIDLAGVGQLEKILNKSSLVICRSGYSTIMDLENFDIPRVYIPTPGQKEQEYLAELQSKNENVKWLQQEHVDRELLKIIL